MKNLKYVLALTLSAAAVVSCQENADMAAIEMPAQGEAIILTATAPATPATRIVENVTADGIEFSWFGGDQYNQPDRISVYNVETGAKVGNFGINERNGAKETATFSPIGPGDPDKMSYEAVYAAADFNLVAGVEYIAVFPASDSETFDARNAETITAEQWQTQKGGWRYTARMVSNKFTTANTSLTFTHETAFMAFDFIVPGGKAAKSFTCTAGETSSVVLTNGFAAPQDQYIAHFAMYPTAEPKLTFTITDVDGTETKVVRNISSEIKAGYYYKQNLIETVGIGNVIANGNSNAGAGPWDAPGVHAYSGGYDFSFVANGGKDGSRCVKAAIKTPFAEYTKIIFTGVTLVEGEKYTFSADFKSSVACEIAVKFQDANNAQKCPITLDDAALPANEWKTVTGEVTIPAGSNINAMIIPLDPVGAGGVFMYDNISLAYDEKVQTMPSDDE